MKVRVVGEEESYLFSFRCVLCAGKSGRVTAGGLAVDGWFVGGGDDAVR